MPFASAKAEAINTSKPMLIVVLVDQNGEKIKCSSIDELITTKFANVEIEELSKNFVLTPITSKAAAAQFGTSSCFIVADGYLDVISTSSLDNPNEAIKRANEVYTEKEPSWINEADDALKEERLIVYTFTTDEGKNSEKIIETLSSKNLWKIRLDERVVLVKESFDKDSSRAKQFGITRDGEVALVRTLADGTQKLVKKLSPKTKAVEIRKLIFSTLAQMQKEAKEAENKENKKEELSETASK